MKYLALKRFWFDLINWRQWTVVYHTQRFFFKIRDYDRLEYDYAMTLSHATNGAMSKTNYTLSAVYSVIDDCQTSSEEAAIRMIKNDLQAIIGAGATKQEIIEAINNL